MTSLAVAWCCSLWSPMTTSRSLPETEATAIVRSLLGEADRPGAPNGVRHSGIGWTVLNAVDAAPRARPPRRTTSRPVPAVKPARDPGKKAARGGRRALPMPVNPDDRCVHVYMAGWPSSCLQGEKTSFASVRTRVSLAPPPAFIGLFGVKPRRELPLRPKWPGLVVNTLFYCAVFWLAVPGPLAARRLIRRRRGCCPRCGYDTAHATHDVCPECGAV